MTIAGKIITMTYAIFYVPLFLYAMTLVFQLEFNKIRLKDELLEREMHDVESDVREIMDAVWEWEKQKAKKT